MISEKREFVHSDVWRVRVNNEMLAVWFELPYGVNEILVWGPVETLGQAAIFARIPFSGLVRDELSVVGAVARWLDARK